MAPLLEKPATREGYTPEFATLVRAGCLTLATEMPEFVEHAVVVGGQVPSLLIDPTRLPVDAEPHVGTRDLDLGLSLVMREVARSKSLEARLRALDFRPDVNERQNQTLQRWIRTVGSRAIAVDFLMEPAADERGGTVTPMTQALGAVVTPGLDLAFRDTERVTISGETFNGVSASATVTSCGPGAFVLLKALAFVRREKDHERNKDAYDLHYVLRNYGEGPASVADRVRPLLDHPQARVALEVLTTEFASPAARGPQRVGRFLGRLNDPALGNDAVTAVANLLRLVRSGAPR